MGGASLSRFKTVEDYWLTFYLKQAQTPAFQFYWRLYIWTGKNTETHCHILKKRDAGNISGYQTGPNTSAVLWKNGYPTIRPNDMVSYAGNNIVIQNGDIYMPIGYQISNQGKTVINYWKNDVPVSLADGTIAINAIEMAVSGADVYVACQTSKGPGYYKNGKLTVFSNGLSDVTGIAVLNNDVYTVGQSLYQQKSVATFWKNGVPVRLFSPIGKSGNGQTIVVTPI